MEDQQSPPKEAISRSRFLGLQSAVQSIKTESALNSLIWFAVIVFSAMCIVAVFDSYLALLLFGLGSGLSCLIAFAYLYFMFNDPNRLQSEKYQIEAKKLDLMLDERGSGQQAINMEPSSNNFISNSGQ